MELVIIYDKARGEAGISFTLVHIYMHYIHKFIVTLIAVVFTEDALVLNFSLVSWNLLSESLS